MKRLGKFLAVAAFLFLFLGVGESVVLDGPIRGKAGLSYSSISYSFDSLNVVIRNRTKYNLNFGGAMLFLDKNYELVARAELRPAKIKRHSSRNYKGFFSKGSGNEAKAARYLEWEF
ncbi:MAG: hypothetical protein IJR94_04830 [Synergistaceae bacterium]|nr:hypothetical protein [Synergistaceae bacterium]